MKKDICVITSLFALVENDYFLARYREFERNLNKQGVELYTIELALNDRPFLLGDEAFIRLRTDSFLWHKETLLNMLAQKVPSRFKKIAWLDADILIENDNWLNDASEALEKYNLIQIGSKHRGYNQRGHVELDQKTFGWGYQNDTATNLLRHYRLGLGWAVRRDFFDKVGMFDYAMDSKDTLTILALVGYKNKYGNDIPYSLKEKYENTPGILDHYKEYQKVAEDYNSDNGCGYIDGDVIHKYHAPLCKRGYQTRYLLSAGMDIDRDLERDSNGLWRWKNQKFQKIWKKYFEVKNSHGDQLKPSEVFRVRGRETFNWGSILED